MRAAVDVVDTWASVEDVGVVAAFKRVVAVAASDHVFAAARVCAVVALAAVDGIVATAALGLQNTADPGGRGRTDAAEDDIVTRPAVDVVVGAPINGVVAVADTW